MRLITNQVIQDGPHVTIFDHAGCYEMMTFESVSEANARVDIVNEAFSWDGTPYGNLGDIKGKKGIVDCAMFLVRVYVDTGRLPPFDPRPYPVQWYLHHNEEWFLDWVVGRLGGHEVTSPRFGDVTIYKFGRCYAHGSIYVGVNRVVHASVKAHRCLMSNIVDIDLLCMRSGEPREHRYYEVRPNG